MIKNIINNMKAEIKKHIKYDVLSLSLLLLWIITSFLFINLGKLDFWSSLFYLFIFHFVYIGIILLPLRLFTYKASSLLINAIYIFILYNLITKTSLDETVWDTFVNDYTLGFKNSTFINIGLLLILGLFAYKKISTKHFSVLFGIMLFSNIITNVPNIYKNISVEVEIAKEQIEGGVQPVYKNPSRPNIYILMVDTYPSFYNQKHYLNFDNKKLRKVLKENNFTIYEKMYSNRDKTMGSMSVFFGNENTPIDDYTYFVGKGHYSKQKHLTKLKSKGYDVVEKKYNPKQDISHNYLTGFYGHIKLNVTKKIINYFIQIDSSLQKLIDYKRYVSYNTIMAGLSHKGKNNITIAFSDELISDLVCFDKSAPDNGTGLTIHNIKCANQNITKSINKIKQYDENSIIVLMADHGWIKINDNQNGRVNWIDLNNPIEKNYGVMLAIHYPKQCANYKKVKFTHTDSVMPLILSCIDGKKPSQRNKDSFSYLDNIEDIPSGNKYKKYIINGVIQK